MINGEDMAESFIDKYIPEVNKIFEAVKFATVSRPSYSPKTKAEKKEYSKYMDFVKQTEKDQEELDKEDANPLISEAISIIGGSRSNELDSNAKLNNWINDKILDLTKWITVNDSKSNVLQHPSTGSLVKETITNVLRSALTNDTLMAKTARMFGGRHGKNIYNTYTATSRLPAYAKLGLRQFVPEGLEEYKDKKTGEIKTRRTYEPISDLNKKEWFSEEEVENISNILKTRDKTSPHYIGLPPGEVDATRHKEVDPDALINNALGKFKYGSYDETGKWQEGLPNLDGTYTIKDTYNWDRDYGSGIGPMGGLLNKMRSDPKSVQRRDIEGTFQAIGPQHSQGEGREIEFTVPTYADTPEGATAWMDVMASRLGPYEGKSPPISSFKTHWLPPEALSPLQTRVEMLGNRVTPLGQGDLPGMHWQSEAFSTDGDTSLDTGTADPGQGGDFSTTEDEGYTSLDIGYRRGGQISQGLDNLYMNKRDSKQKLNNMMGFQERQYGGGLDDAYMNRRRSNAFADPNANTAFDSPMSIGGLPTVYRADSGPAWGDYPDDAAFDDAMAGSPTDDGLGDVLGGGNFDPYPSVDPGLAALTGRGQSIPVTAPPTTDDEPPSWTPAAGRDKRGYLSTPIPSGLHEMSTGSETMLRDTLRRFGDSDKLFDKMTDQQKRNFESAYHGKSLFGDIGADDFSKGYRFGGAEGTLQDILEQSIASDMDINDLISEADYRKKYEEEFEKSQSQRELTGIELIGAGLMDVAKDIAKLTSIQSDLPKDDPYIMDQIMERAEAAGLNPQPVSSFGSKMLDYGITAALGFPGTIAKGLHNLSGAGNTIMTVTKDGVEYNVSDTGKFSLNMPDADIDYGNEPTPTRQPRPVEKKKAAPKTEEKKATAEKTSDLPSIKESNIERLKTYMSLTGKDLSDSKQDLDITDISITEEDFT